MAHVLRTAYKLSKSTIHIIRYSGSKVLAILKRREVFHVDRQRAVYPTAEDITTFMGVSKPQMSKPPLHFRIPQVLYAAPLVKLHPRLTPHLSNSSIAQVTDIKNEHAA